MSLTQAISIALTSLRVNSQMMSVTSNNIANAQTEGFSSKSAVLSNVTYGSDPGGVAVVSYTRATDQAVSNNLQAAITDSSYYSTLNDYMLQVQTNFDSTSDNPALSSAMSAFASAWSTYSSSPESTIEKTNVLNAGRSLASVITSISSKTVALDRQVQQDLNAAVSTLNNDLQKIATLNQQIQDATTSGQPAGDLQDKRDAVVRDIATYTQIVVQARVNGQVAIYTSSGQALVDGTYANTYSFDGTNIYDNNSVNVSSFLAGGSIEAGINFRDTSTAAAASTEQGVGVIAKIQSQLSLICDALTGSSGTVTSAFATAYSSAVTSSTAATGTQFGQTLAAQFFTVTNDVYGNPDPNTFAVTSSLLTGAAGMPQTGSAAIYNAFDSTQSYSTNGLSTSNASYSELASTIVTNFQQIANSISASEKSNSDLAEFYKTKLTNNTGVNMDQELSNLILYQNSYAASSKLISTVRDMYQQLLNIMG